MTQRLGSTVIEWCCLVVTFVMMCSIALLGAEGDRQLADAAERQDIATIRTLLAASAGLDVNGRRPDGATALLWAAQWNDVEMTDLLLAAGADPNAANDYGMTPLAMAVTNGSVPIVERLLAAGADATASLPSGETVLMTAAMVGNVAVAGALIEHGADVNAQETIRGQTALMWAVSEGHADLVRLLLDHGADVARASTAGYTPLLVAARYGDMGIVDDLLGHGADVNQTASDGTSALLVALTRGHVEQAYRFLDEGADPNAGRLFKKLEGELEVPNLFSYSGGYAPLHWAAGNWEAATSIAYGRDGNEWEAMGGLTRARKHAVITTLLAHGADANAPVEGSGPPLGKALGSGNYVTVVGASRASLEGATPYFLAALGGDAETMRLLVANGADPLRKLSDQTTPVAVAAGFNAYTVHTTLSEAQHLEAVKVAIELGDDVNAANDLGNTAMHTAAYAGFNSVIEALVDAGAKINEKNEKGETPLRIADGVIVIMMLYRHPETAAFLRSLGATY